MIKCDKGGTAIVGTVTETIQDFTNIIRAVRIALEDELTQEAADEIIKLCGRLAYANGEKAQEAEALDLLAQALINGKS